MYVSTTCCSLNKNVFVSLVWVYGWCSPFDVDRILYFALLFLSSVLVPGQDLV